MTEKQKISVIYHSIFNYKLSKEELKKWSAGVKLRLKQKVDVRYDTDIKNQKLKKLNFKFSQKKLLIAKSVAAILGRVPTVLFVGITGSLAMNNASETSDIDLMVITTKNTLWITRVVVYMLLFLTGTKHRKPKDKTEKDLICLNLWMDTTELAWSGPRNAYIAHEVAQVISLTNKEKTYEKWINKNLWIKDYWPNAVNYKKISRKSERKDKQSFVQSLISVINHLCFLFQKGYMQRKITRETVTPNKAFFHPYDWGLRVVKELEKKGVSEV